MRKRSGYTIIEVLVAVIIMAIVLPGLTIFVVGSRKTQVGNVRFENAAAYGQAIYDELSLLPAAKVAASGTKTTVIDGQSYSATWAKSAMTQGGSNLHITVGWTVGGKSHTSVLNGVLP